MNVHIRQILQSRYVQAALLLTIVGFALRFYNIEGFITFLGDQGRDAIIMKRIVLLEHFPAVGAPSSVGQVYLGPFYYYFIAPWLLLTAFNPVGPAIGVAFFSTAFLFGSYFMIKDVFDKKTAIVSVLLMTFSGVLVSLSRFSWNPNLLSVFALTSVYFFYKALRTHRALYFVLAGAFLSFTMQLHYVALALFVPLDLISFWYIYKHRRKIMAPLKNFAAMLGSFILFSAPLIIFDLKHNFLNIINFISLFTSGDTVSASRGLGEIFYTFASFNNIVFGAEMHNFVSWVILLCIGLALAVLWKTKTPLKGLLFIFLLALLVTSYFTGNKFPHYFGALYPFYFILISYFVSKVFWTNNRANLVLLGLFLVVYVMLQAPRYTFLYNEPNNQIQKGQAIAGVIYENIDVERYRITGIPDSYGDSVAAYFLEIDGKRPIQKDTIEKGDELFAICEQPCKPLEVNQWSVTFFEPSQIVGSWEVEDVTIYKLVR